MGDVIAKVFGTKESEQPQQDKIRNGPTIWCKECLETEDVGDMVPPLNRAEICTYHVDERLKAIPKEVEEEIERRAKEMADKLVKKEEAKIPMTVEQIWRMWLIGAIGMYQLVPEGREMSVDYKDAIVNGLKEVPSGSKMVDLMEHMATDLNKGQDEYIGLRRRRDSIAISAARRETIEMRMREDFFWLPTRFADVYKKTE
ncbi:hypothetical protein LTR70_001827 [Exophiala xenobiotica]|uniref:Uncharacterized protein n=1 Tax=Lithohypha guttulata TaxID=1690604 RepID=A0ABR0KLU9_9EURO|nr:hypothetical protein LTR24_000979 [Lithohypha guttulata]KAK5327085.1 hypothetical protein LTR70_001827 [Exophiala xenobiotica]